MRSYVHMCEVHIYSHPYEARSGHQVSSSMTFLLAISKRVSLIPEFDDPAGMSAMIPLDPPLCLQY